jgi:hypothetical protein
MINTMRTSCASGKNDSLEAVLLFVLFAVVFMYRYSVKLKSGFPIAVFPSFGGPRLTERKGREKDLTAKAIIVQSNHTPRFGFWP